MSVEHTDFLLKVHGSSRPTEGVVGIKGAKNAVSKLMLASVVSDKPYTLSNMPMISEVGITASMLQELGVEVELNGTNAKFDGSKLFSNVINEKYTGVNRIPILLLGRLAHKMGSAKIPLPGGDPIGKRPIDFHVTILEAFGITVNVKSNVVEAIAGNDVHPATVEIPFQSVGATEQFMLTAAGIEGASILKNAAMEPEVQELGTLLTSMGSVVHFHEDTKSVVVLGTTSFNETHHHIQADPLVAVSYLSAALTSHGSVTVTDVNPAGIQTALNVFEQMGADIRTGANWVKVDAKGKELQGVSVATGPAPEFRTDWQAFVTVAATRASGISYIHEKVYPNRFVYSSVLKAMGADIEVHKECSDPKCFWYGDHPHYAVIKGNGRLQAVNSPLQDIRGAFASVLAAANAKGTSHFTGVHHLIRGYHKIEESLAAIGIETELYRN